MSMHEVAKHISALGRNGDSMLVHMSPSEVKALHGIGSLTGSRITINPDTGLPEAFSFGDFFKSLLPTVVGAVAAPFTGGSSLIPVLAGAATGAVLNKDNPLMGALTGGIGGFGGAGIGSALGKAGAAAQTAGTVGSGAGNLGITATGGINPAYANAAGTAISEAALPTAAAQGTTTFFGPAAQATQTGALGSLGQGIGALGTETGRSAYTQALGGTGPNADLIAAGKTALPIGMAALTGIEPPTLPEEEEYKYNPNSVLNLSGDTGLRFYAEGGQINETPDPGIGSLQDKARYGLASLSSDGGAIRYASGGTTGLFSDKGSLNLGTGTTSMGGSFSPQQFEQYYNAYRADQALRGKSLSPGFPYINTNGLNKLAEQRGVSSRELMKNPNAGLSEEQVRFNQMMGASNPPNFYNDPFRGYGTKRNLTPEQKQFNAMLADYNKQGSEYLQSQLTPEELRKQKIYNTGMFGAAGLANRPNTSVASYTKPLSIWENNQANYGPSLFGEQSLKLAEGGKVVDDNRSLNLNTGKQELNNVQQPTEAWAKIFNFFKNPTSDPYTKNNNYNNYANQMLSLAYNMGGSGVMQNALQSPVLGQYYYADGGGILSNENIQEKSKGGYLDGPGDGMSDSIPATIEGKQPARLADGEFVVPADVVSHLGNGSTKAGAKKLYEMLDKVRKARTGHSKQGKQINPNRYMPA